MSKQSNKQGKVILFQGDSITDANRERDNEIHGITGHSYAYIVAAHLGHLYPEKHYEFINRAISGNRMSDLYARWNEDAISLQPDVISILIGVNDAWRTMGNEPSGFTDRLERAYRHVLEETVAVLPDTKLVLCEPFILKGITTEARWDEWQALIQKYQAIVAQLAQEFNAVFVPLQALFDEAATKREASYWIWDGVHPTSAGHGLISQQWLKVVEASNIL